MEKKIFLITLFLINALLIAMLLDYSEAFFPIKNFVKMLFEGNSAGKTISFLLFSEILLITVFLAKKFGKKNTIVPGKKKEFLFFWMFLIPIILLWANAISSQLNHQQEFSLPLNSGFAAMPNEQNSIIWEASYLQHNHLNKTGIAKTLEFFSLEKTNSLDTGYSLYLLVGKQKPVHFFIIALIAISLIGIIGYTAAKFSQPNKKFLLWIIAAFAGITSGIDGGIFSIVGINFIGLLSMFLAIEYNLKNPFFQNNKLFQFVLLPFIEMLAIALTLQFLTGTWFFANHGIIILIIGFTALAIANQKKALQTALIIILFAAILFFPETVSLLNQNIAEKQAEIAVYGNFENMNQEQVFSLLKEFNPKEIFFEKNIIIAAISLEKPMTSSQIAMELKARQSQSKKSFLEISIGKKEKEFTITVKNKEEADSLKEINNNFFKTATVFKKNNLFFATIRSKHNNFLNQLFVLNHLRKTKAKTITIGYLEQ